MSVLSSRPRRILLAVCGGLVLFFGARWAFLQGKPERLRDLPKNNDLLLFIRGGVTYYRVNYPLRNQVISVMDISGKAVITEVPMPQPITLRALPVQGGPGRILAEAQPPPNTRLSALPMTENSLPYLANSEAWTHSLRFPVQMVEYARDGRTSIPVKRTMALSLHQAHLYTLPLSGGAPVAFRPDITLHIAESSTNGWPVCFTDDRICWIDVDPKKRPAQKSGSLKVASKNGGPPETLMTGLSPRTGLVLSGAGTVWMSAPARVPPDMEALSRSDIYSFDIAENKPRLVRQNVENSLLFGSIIPSNLLWEGRRYWTHTTASISDTSYQTSRTEILSSALDGSDQRVVHTFSDAESEIALRAHAGKLYVDLRKKSNRFLMRFEPGSPVRLRELFRFPTKKASYLVKDSYFDGDYLYYVQDEEREKWWDWSVRGLQPTEATVLYRYRLPR
jgi:hypothetical protein